MLKPFLSLWSPRAGLACAALLICAAAAAPGTARADTASAKPFYDRGIVEYNLGHFAEAIVQFEKAYEQDRAPILLFNIAQAHRQSANPERALFFYRRYLENDPHAANRSDVEKRMAELDEMVKRQAEVKSRPPTSVAGPGPATQPPPTAAAPPAPPPDPSPASTVTTVGSTPTTAPAATATVTETASPPQTGGGNAGGTMKIAGIATASAGAASVLVGVLFSARVSSSSNDVSGGAVFDPDAESSAKSAATMQWVFYGVGAAAIVTGAALYYFGHQKSRSAESRMALLPILGPGQPAGAALRVSF
jgi:tetratricopeptide (TPR) repeat protein